MSINCTRFCVRFTWRGVFLLTGVVLILGAAFLPVKYVVDRAISPDIVQLLQDRGMPERIVELREQFRTGLGFLRIAACLFGVWLLLIGKLWDRIAKWSAQSGITVGRSDLQYPVNVKREIWFPVIWMIIVIVICTPLLFKGIDNLEVVNLEMMAKRGPLVTMACQNLSPRAVQPGFTVVESFFVKAFGDSEAIPRIPALLFGALAMFPVFFIARRYGPVLFANLACMALAVTGFYLFYDTYARGYALAMTAYISCVLTAVCLRERSTWPRWVFFAIFTVIAAYTHLASGLYIACLLFVILIDRSIRACKKGPVVPSVLRASVQPVVAFGSAVMVVFFLLSVALPASMRYMKTFSLTDYYMSYHVNLRFLRVMVESWAWVRDCPPLAWAQAILFVAGLVWALVRFPWITVYLVVPAVLALTLIWSRGMYLFTRYILHFLPVYVLLSVFPVWRLFFCKLKINRRAVAILLVALLAVTGSLTLKRLYVMERCGIRTAIEDARGVMDKDDRIMAVLDGYVTVKYYYPDVVSGYKDKDFWKEINSEDPPEFLINVPYTDYDIMDGNAAILEKYDLFKTYPSWSDVDDDQDSIYLYRRKGEGE